DVKPANVLLGQGTGSGKHEHAYLADFGLTKRTTSVSGLTGTGTFVGSLDYIAPEQIEGRLVDARTDIYSLGCVMFETLTGRVPFVMESEIATIYAHLEQAAPSAHALIPELPESFDRVLARAMAKSPEDRYPTCADMVDDAKAALDGATDRRQMPT